MTPEDYRYGLSTGNFDLISIEPKDSPETMLLDRQLELAGARTLMYRFPSVESGLQLMRANQNYLMVLGATIYSELDHGGKTIADVTKLLSDEREKRYAMLRKTTLFTTRGYDEMDPGHSANWDMEQAIEGVVEKSHWGSQLYTPVIRDAVVKILDLTELELSNEQDRILQKISSL